MTTCCFIGFSVGTAASTAASAAGNAPAVRFTAALPTQSSSSLQAFRAAGPATVVVAAKPLPPPPTGMAAVDLSGLSEEEKRKIAEVMERAQAMQDMDAAAPAPPTKSVTTMFK